MDGTDPNIDWASELRAFRQRNSFKQEAAASLLGVSQAYISRVENGTVSPSETLIHRLTMLSQRPEHRPMLDLMKTAIRHSPAWCTLFCLRGGDLVIAEHSRSFYGAGHPFDEHRRGSRFLWEDIGEEARGIMQALIKAGAFDGRFGVMEAVWKTAPKNGHALRCFKTTFTPFRSDDGEWLLHACIVEIEESMWAAARQTWGGPIRFFDHDEDPPTPGRKPSRPSDFRQEVRNKCIRTARRNPLGDRPFPD